MKNIKIETVGNDGKITLYAKYSNNIGENVYKNPKTNKTTETSTRVYEVVIYANSLKFSDASTARIATVTPVEDKKYNADAAQVD